MEFENYRAARDLLYLAALFAGSGTGCVLNRFRLKSVLRFRNRAVTLALCLFSGMAAALAGALICSNTLIIFEKSFYISALIITVLLILAVRFPLAAGFPLILLSGCAVIWIGFSFLRFPLLGAGESFVVSVYGEGNGQYAARFASGRGANSEQLLLIRLEGREQPAEGFLEFCFVRISYAPAFPLVGGESRGQIMEIRGESGVFYADPSFALLRGWYACLRGLSGGAGNRRLFFEEFREKVPAADIRPGMTRELGFGGS